MPPRSGATRLASRPTSRSARQRAQSDATTTAASGQRGKDAAVGMIVKRLLDLAAIFLDLCFQGAQLLGERHRPHAFGGSDRRGRTDELIRPREDGQAFFYYLRAIEAMGMQQA